MSTANLVSVRTGAALIDAATSIDEADMNQETAAAHAAAAGWIALTLQQDRAACDEFISQLKQHVPRPDVVTYLFCLLKDGARRLVVVEYCQGVDIETAVQAGEAESVPLQVLTRVVERMRSLRNPDDPEPDAPPVPSGPFVLDDFGLASAVLDDGIASCGAAVVTPKHVQSFGPQGADLHTFQTDLVHLDEVLSRQGVSRIVRAAAGDRPLKLWLGSSVPKQAAPPPAKKASVTASVPAAVAPAPAPPPSAPVQAASIQSLAKAFSPVDPSVVPPVPAESEVPPPRIIRVRLRDETPPATPQVRPPEPPKPPKPAPPPAPPPPKEAKTAPIPAAPEPEVFTLGIPEEEKQRPRVVIWVGIGAAALIAVIVLLVLFLPRSAPPVAPQTVQTPATSPAPASKEPAAQTPQTTVPAPQPAAPTPAVKDKPPETTAAVPTETAPAPPKKAEAAPPPPAPEKAAEDDAVARKKAAIKALTGQ
jgi:hypothetical protein